MPYTGSDPGFFDSGMGPDLSGGGLDPSYYYALSPGGRFPGDQENALQYAAATPGQRSGNPSLDLGALTNLPGGLGAFFRFLQSNGRTGGAGQAPAGPGGYPYQFWSGPAADYGPPGGPLNGLVDMGRQGIYDMPEHRPTAGNENAPGGPAKKPGGGSRGHFTFTPYGGLQTRDSGASFVDWQPITPGTPGPYPPTHFVGGGSGPLPAPPLPGAGGGGGHGGRGSGGGGGKPTKPPTTKPGDPLAGILSSLGFSPGDRPGALGPDARANAGAGVDTNYLDFGTPGAFRDPTTGIVNTSGFPGATLPEMKPGESVLDYMNRLHDAGVAQSDIFGMLGRYGYQTDGSGNLNGSWAWGAGPVVRGDTGYHFASQGSPSGGGNPGERAIQGVDSLAAGVLTPMMF